MQAVVLDIALPHRAASTGITAPALQQVPCIPPPRAVRALTEFSLFAGLDAESIAKVALLLSRRVRLHKSDALFRVGDPFGSLYAIRTGSCKTVLLAKGGQDQVAGYHMAGEIIGIDGIGTRVHDCQATALEEMEVCPLPFDEIENLARRSEPLRRNLHTMISLECARARSLMLLLGTMRAEQRLAVFLLDLSDQHRMHGYSSCEFVLRMTREEIGSYLGLKLETVSRLFSRFQHDGLIQVQGRAVKMLDRAAVGHLLGCEASRACDASIGLPRLRPCVSEAPGQVARG